MSRDVKLWHRLNDGSGMPKEALALQSCPKLGQDRLHILCQLTWAAGAVLNTFLANNVQPTRLLPTNECLSGGFHATQIALRGEQWTAGKNHGIIRKHL